MTLRVTRFHRTTRTATTAAAFVSLGVAAFGSPASASGQSAEPWPTKEFEVISSEAFNPFAAPVFNAVSEQVDEWLVASGMEPTGARIYVPHPETRREIEDYLTEAAGVLEGWGFPSPKLQRPFGKYKIVLAVEPLSGETAAGEYAPPIFGLIGGLIFLNANAILGEREEEDGRRHLTPNGRATLAHELFHAVQANTRFHGAGPTTAGAWIIEGTADAIGVDILRRLRGEETSDWVDAWGARNYSKRLPVPRVISLLPQDVSEDRLAAYYTSSFWRYLAEFQALGSAPGPEVNPFDYSYLAKMLSRQPASSDCFGSGAECDSELRWLTIGLKENFGLTLRELYPLFAESLALYGDHRLSDVFGHIRMWRSRTFGDCPYFELAPRPNGRVYRHVIPTFEPVSTHCWEIVVLEFGRTTLVEISVKAPPGGRAIADLSVAVAGRPIRADTAVVDTTATGELTARWVVELPHERESVVVLTNVANDPANTTQMRNLPISFTALESNAVVSVSGAGDSGGSGSSSGFPLGDPTLGFEATRWWFGVHTSDEIAAAIPASQSPPPGNACQVQLTLAADDVVGEENVSVILMGWVPAPLAPGAWPVGEYQSQDRVGEFYADVVVPCQFGGCVPSGPSKGHKYRMVGFHGELELTDVSRSHVAGRFDITAGAGEPYAGIGLSGIYSVTLGGPADAGEKTLRADHPCAPPAPDSKPSAPGGNGANPVGDGPGEEPADAGDGDPGADGEEDAPPGADGAPGEANPDAEAGAPAEAGDQEADEAPPEANPEAQGGELKASELILDFPQDGRSVLRSEPQAVQGTGSVTGVALASRTYDLTVALPVFGCTVEMGDVPAAEQFQLALAHDRWLKSGRTAQGLVLFDFTAAELRLDAASGGVTLDLESAEGGVTMRGTAENAVSLRAGGPATIVGDVSDATLEVTRGDDTFRCAEPMDFSFTVAGMD